MKRANQEEDDDAATPSAGAVRRITGAERASLFGAGASRGQLPARRILVVEDDDSIAMGLEMNLQAEGYQVTVARDGELGLSLAQSQSFDLLILDLMLPRLNGFELLRNLRAEGYMVPVILLSARGAEMDKVMGLELGAEDYITKPFGLAEMLARVKAVLRRDAIARPDGAALRAGELSINRDTREVRRGGALVELTATEFDVLICLVEAAGRVLSREQIQGRVWGPAHHGTTRTIDNFILQLRSKLEDNPAAPRHIVTVRGVGYRFVS
ncbi:response regulator transcription factor [Chondromyces apiculatus]|uniref:Phosphate regulon transcriptional regulatory protein PhoB n=1 Tax=Chondromyces apiculatus DSM 436 TaxID=1192034 RepID=A0A017SYJ4_9BACT|nr:response regulator transcription factor [Chondromyces apiculatus]EYF02018.1 Response regulator receiver:Transcriptional regulatory protein, C- terminal precursor [Chondromyces apiculatus DSM 436]